MIARVLRLSEEGLLYPGVNFRAHNESPEKHKKSTTSSCFCFPPITNLITFPLRSSVANVHIRKIIC